MMKWLKGLRPAKEMDVFTCNCGCWTVEAPAGHIPTEEWAAFCIRLSTSLSCCGRGSNDRADNPATQPGGAHQE